ncbi:MAG: hypothetical protein MUF25_15655, partial [Pirellulaceae bacterium]|nr:hypothetical protein [Pirellulaceae bacterium]
MKITSIETLVCHARMRNWVFVKLLTDQPGLVGWGEATLGTWKYVPAGDDRRRACEAWQVREFVVPLPYRKDLPNPDEVKRQR